MPYTEPFRAACFEKQYNYLLTDKFPKSKNSVDDLIKKIISSPIQGDRFPGFGQDIHIRKLRVGLKEYCLSKRDGLRLIWQLNEKNKWVLFVAIYYESEYSREQKIQAMIRENLKSIISHIEKEFPQ